MSDLKPVGEFGSVEWCEACGKAGAKMLQDANLPADTAWGFTENYLYSAGKNAGRWTRNICLLLYGERRRMFWR